MALAHELPLRVRSVDRDLGMAGISSCLAVRDNFLTLAWLSFKCQSCVCSSLLEGRGRFVGLGMDGSVFVRIVGGLFAVTGKGRSCRVGGWRLGVVSACLGLICLCCLRLYILGPYAGCVLHCRECTYQSGSRWVLVWSLVCWPGWGGV